jgi:hypothetical protein
MGMFTLLIIFLVVLLAILHFWTTDRYTDAIGFPTGAYRRFLRRREVRSPGMIDIPPPPDGKRDEEIEALLRAGDFEGARQVLSMRMDEARMAPLGRDAAIARVSHYMNLLGDR